jgi:hypothetical protein
VASGVIGFIPGSGATFLFTARTKRDNGVFRCTLDGSHIARTLEIPAWMFDCAACVSGTCIEADPFVRSGSARRIVRFARPGVEDRRAIIECPASGRIWALSRPAVGVRSKSCPGSQQMDLFASPRVVVAPDWSDLPEGARETLLGLMTRLILDHAQAAATLTRAEAGHDR